MKQGNSGAVNEAMDADDVFARALEHHRAGRLAQAEAGYRALLQTAPDHVDASHLLGMLLNQQGRGEAAVELITRAIAGRPAYEALHNNLGVVLFGLGRLDAAVTSYGKAVAIRPDYAEAHNNLGYALYRLGRLDQAIACYETALKIKPFYAEALNHLGIALQAQGRVQEAVVCYRQAIGLNPDIAQSHGNLASALIALGNLAEAIAFCEKALAIDPANVEAHNNLGIALFAQGRIDDAIACYRRALALAPDHADALHNLGGALHAQGRYAESLACYRKVIELQPANSAALHMIAALTGGASERPPDQYVTKVFDDYADRFDAHLVRELEYDTPALLAKFVREHSAAPGAKWDVLDLGCGTGLSGEALAPMARQLVGVDLSGKMLDKARAKSIYTRLETSELLEMTRREAASSYDLVFATDVFIYVGKLDNIVGEAKRLLRAGGLFAFSAEAIEGLAAAPPPAGARGDYQLLPNGRYAHSAAYLERLAAGQGFKIRRMTSAPIRKEQGVPVPGWLTVWER